MALRYLREPGTIIGTAAEFTARNLILLARQVGIETDTGSSKLGDGLTAWDSLAYLPGGGGDQIAAKSTNATPVGAPGLYASASETPADGGWWNVNLTADAVDLSAGTDAGDSSIAFALTDPIGGGVHGDGPARGELTITADDGDTNVIVGLTATTDPDNGGPSAEVLVRGAGAGTAGGVISLICGTEGAEARLSGVPGQTAILLRLDDVYGAPIFWVDMEGPILYSPNSTGYRLKVANDGTLSTEAV